MFDDNKYKETDDLMRSLLAQGEEEVPPHIWEGISSELDRIDAAKTRKVHVLWLRRAAIATAAAAAVAIGAFVDWSGNGDIIPNPTDSRMIAVAEGTALHIDNPLSKPSQIAERYVPYLADAEEEVSEAIAKVTEAMEEAEVAETVVVSEDKPEVSNEAPKATETVKTTEEVTEIWPADWEDDEVEKVSMKRNRSLVISGIAGTNSVQKSGLSPLRSPSISTTKPKTGVEQKSSESTYGLPISAGAGVKIGLNDRWSLGVGANYTILTRKFFGTYTKVNGEGSIETSISSDIRNVQRYVGIPVNVFYTLVSNEYMNFYTYAGGTVEKCISDKYDILNTEHIYKGSVSGVQASANIGLGMEFMLGKRIGLYMDPSLRYYFDCGQPKSIRTAQPLMLGIEMGLRFNL